MSLLRPMAKPSLERGSVNVTLTSLYVWINHKLQVASKSIFYQIAQTPETFTVILTTTTVMLMVLVGKYVVRNLQRKSPVLLAAFPFPFLNNRRALSICSLPLFSLCISFAFPPIHPTGSLLLKCFLSLFLLFPSPVSCLLLPFFSSFTPSLLHPICLIISLAHFQLTPHLKANTHPLASVSHGSEVIGQMHHLVLLPRIILIQLHILYGATLVFDSL